MQKLNMKENKYSGSLFTFCGLDGCGKTSMIKRLAEYFKEQDIYPLFTKQPTNAVRNSSVFKTYMNSPDHKAYAYRSLSLMAAGDRVQHTEKVIEPVIRQGGIVISDRYFYSCLANLHARGYTKDQWIYEIAHFILKPTISFFLDVPVKTAVKRVRGRENEKNRYIDMELQYRLREEYLQIAEAAEGIVICTDQPEEKSFQSVVNAVESYIGYRKCSGGSL